MKNGNKPSISVVVPAFNEEKYIGKCLKAINKQTFRDFELIVVNNNSTDNTASIAKKYNARVVNEKKQGMTPARERGFREAKADIIARTDADSRPTEEWLEVIFRTFQKNPDVVAITGPWLSPYKKIPDEVFINMNKVLAVNLGMLTSGHVHVYGPNMAIRKKAWEKIRVNKDDRKVHEDIDLSCNIGKVGKILYVPEMKIIYSLRRVTENPIKGLYRYLNEYPVRYLRTLYVNNPDFYKEVIKKGIPKKLTSFSLSNLNRIEEKFLKRKGKRK